MYAPDNQKHEFFSDESPPADSGTITGFIRSRLVGQRELRAYSGLRKNLCKNHQKSL